MKQEEKNILERHNMEQVNEYLIDDEILIVVVVVVDKEVKEL